MENYFRRLLSLLSDGYRIFMMNLSINHEVNVLNESSGEVFQQIPATEVAALLQRMILKLKGKYFSEDGKSVDYVQLRNDDLFKEFQTQAEQLAHVTLADLNPAQRKAFFINIYNTLTIHALSKVEPLPQSLLEVSNFWKHSAYNINGLVFSLDDVEHGILRANTRHPSALTKPFKNGDPRLQFSLKELDPRIHFALNCGGKSCPAIGVYNEINLETALTSATINFLSESVQTNEKNTIHLSKLFLWYGADFGSSDKDILRWICQYMPDSDSRKETIMQLVEAGNFKVLHDEYNWLINAK